MISILKIMAEIRKFMCERYGLDELYKFLLYVYMGLAFINLFLRTKILFWMEFIILVVIIYRSLSKNILRRRKENEIYLNIVDNIFKPFVNIKRNLKDKEHIYKRCVCGTTLKLPLPKKYGIKHAKCPACKRRVAFLALKKEKVVIISKEKAEGHF